MYAVIDQHTAEPPKVTYTADRNRESIRINYGATALTLDVQEAVDLIDSIATVLGALPQPPTELHRDSAAVLHDAEVREGL